MCNYGLPSSPLADGIVATWTPFSSYLVAQAAWIPGYASVQVLLGRPDPFLVALVPYFLFPQQVSLRTNNPSEAIQTPQDFSLRFSLQTALYPSIAFPLCRSFQRSCCWLVLCVSRNANEALSDLFSWSDCPTDTAFKANVEGGFLSLDFVLALCFLNQPILSRSGNSSSLFKNFINHTEEYLVSQLLNTTACPQQLKENRWDSLTWQQQIWQTGAQSEPRSSHIVIGSPVSQCSVREFII